MPSNQFNPAGVVITLNLGYLDVNKILHALGKFPYDEVRGLITAIQSAGLEQVQAAEGAHAAAMAWNEAVEKAKEDSLITTEKQECKTDQS